MIALVAHAQGTIVPVRAQPGARKDAILGIHAGSLRVAVAAAPEKGKANAAIVALLAATLGCKPAQVGLLSGAASRQKRFVVEGMTPDDVQRRLGPLLAPTSSGSG